MDIRRKKCSILGRLLDVGGVNSDLLVVLLERSEIFTRLGELTLYQKKSVHEIEDGWLDAYLFHTLADVPVNEGTLRVQEIEFVVKPAPRGRNRSGIRQHAHTAGRLCQITARDVGRRLVADPELESGGAPVDELDGALGFDDGDGGADILRDDISTEKQRTRH